MKYIIWLIGGIVIGTTSYVWLTAEVPGGEKRYQHYIRETMDRQSIPGVAAFR